MRYRSLQRFLLDSHDTVIFTLLLFSAISCCLYMDSIYIELPYLVPYAPEGWDLGAFTAILNGFGKLSLLGIPLAIKFGLRNTLHVCNVLGILLGTSLIFTWNKTMSNKFFDYDLSVGFLAHAGLLFATDSLRSVVFLMHLQQDYPKPFLTAGLVGQVSSGILATIMSCLQGYRVAFRGSEKVVSNMSHDFSFGPQIAFSIVVTIMLASSLSFAFLQLLNSTIYRNQSNVEQTKELSKFEKLQLLPPNISNQNSSESSDKSSVKKYYLWVIAAISLGNLFAFSPTFFTYTALAYNQRCCTLSVILWGLTLPLTGLIAHFKPIVRKLHFFIFLLAMCAIFVILIGIALHSPHPPFADSAIMQVCIIMLWGAEAFICYMIYASAVHCLQKMNDPDAFKWGVILAHTGSCVLSVIFFSLLNFTDLIKQ